MRPERHVVEHSPAGIIYDDLPPSEKATVRSEWSHAIASSITALDLSAEFEREGRSYVEADENGRVYQWPARD